MYAYPAGGSIGDDDVFTAMCERHRARLVAFCGRRLRTSHDAEDAAHEVLLRAYRALPAFDDSTDAWPWLRTIAARVCTDMMRRAARTPTPAVLDRHVVDDVHEQVVSRLRADILDDAIGQLPPRYRMPLLLREYGGWSYGDIARTQGKSLSSVRSLLTRSRRRLETHVESVARERGQWPLPGVVPPMRRLRSQLRSWRSGLDRSGHAMLSVFDLSSVAARWMIGAHATLASVLSLSTAVAAVLLSGTSAQPTSDSQRVSMSLPAQQNEHLAISTSAGPVAASSSVTMTPPTRTFSGIDATKPVPEDYNPLDANSRAGMVDYEKTLWIGIDVTATVPVVGEMRITPFTTVQCTWDPQRTFACETARSVFDRLPDH